MNTLSWDAHKITVTLSDKAMAFLQQLDAFWWSVSQCVHCETFILDSELMDNEDGVDALENPNCGCQNPLAVVTPGGE